MTILNNKETRIPEVLFVIPFCLSLATIVVALRFWVRWRRVKLWNDDWFILLALICGLGLCIDLIVLIQYGYGSHMRNVPKTVDPKTTLKLLIVGQLFYFTSIGLIKVSILLFCLRIDQWMKISVYVMMAVTAGITFATDVATVFQCTPVAYAWDISIKGGYCMNRSAFWESLAYLNIVSDLIIYFLPVHTLYKVRMPKRQRFILIFIFAMGMFTILTEVFRLRTLKAPGKTNDPTWDNVPCSLWSVVEFAVGIICASLPSLKPMFAKFLGEYVDPRRHPDHVPNMTSVYFDSVEDPEGKKGRRRVDSFGHGHEKPLAEPGSLMWTASTSNESDADGTTTRMSGKIVARPSIAVTRTGDVNREEEVDDLSWVVYSST